MEKKIKRQDCRWPAYVRDDIIISCASERRLKQRLTGKVAQRWMDWLLTSEYWVDAMCVLAPTALPKEHGARIATAAMIRPAAVVSCTPPPSRAIKFLLFSRFLYAFPCATVWPRDRCAATVPKYGNYAVGRRRNGSPTRDIWAFTILTQFWRPHRNCCNVDRLVTFFKNKFF